VTVPAYTSEPSPAREDRARVSRPLVVAVVVALLLVAAGAAAVVWAQREREDARLEKTRLATELAVSSDAGSRDRLASTRNAIASVRAQIDAISGELKQVTDLQAQDVALVQAALDAGKKGDVPAYNEAVGKRNDLAPQVDASIEKLRTDVNTVLLALARLTNRTAP
jgi:hypothetical protein